MRRPLPLSTRLLRIGSIAPQDIAHLSAELLKIRGVADVVIIAEDRVAYLKVNRHELDQHSLMAYSATD